MWVRLGWHRMNLAGPVQCLTWLLWKCLKSCGSSDGGQGWQLIKWEACICPIIILSSPVVERDQQPQCAPDLPCIREAAIPRASSQVNPSDSIYEHLPWICCPRHSPLFFLVFLLSQNETLYLSHLFNLQSLFSSPNQTNQSRPPNVCRNALFSLDS